MTVSLPPPPERARAEAPAREPAPDAARGRSTHALPDAAMWLEADGRGGYARLGHDGGAPRHAGEGLLIVPCGAQRTPHVLVSTLDERVALAARPGDRPPEQRTLALDCTAFEGGVVPTWTLQLCAAGVALLTLRREVLQPRGRHATLVRWTLLEGDAATLVLRPRLPFRPVQPVQPVQPDGSAPSDPRRSLAAVSVGGALLVRPCPSLPALRFGADVALDFRAAPRKAHHAHGAGGPWIGEAQASPGELLVPLTRGVPFTLELALSHTACASPDAAFRREVARRVLASRADRAAERFLAHTDEGRATVLCGWHSAEGPAPLGAEAFRVLPGLTFDRGARDLGLRVLDDALPFLDAGLMPERFGVDADTSRYGGEAPGLWFAWAARRALVGAPAEHPRLRAALRAIAERFGAGLALVDHAPSEGRLVELALGADLAGHLAQAGGRRARGWSRLHRRASELFRAQLALVAGPRPRLVGAMLEHSPLDRDTRRALVEELTGSLGGAQARGLDPDELAWFTAAALRSAPATRPRLAALAALWNARDLPRATSGAADVAAWLSARAALEGAPR